MAPSTHIPSLVSYDLGACTNNSHAIPLCMCCVQNIRAFAHEYNGKKKNKIISYHVCAKWNISVLFGSLMYCFLLALRHYKIASLEIFMLYSINAHKTSGQLEHSIHSVSSVSLRNHGLISHPLKAKAKFL